MLVLVWQFSFHEPLGKINAAPYMKGGGGGGDFQLLLLFSDRCHTRTVTYVKIVLKALPMHAFCMIIQ